MSESKPDKIDPVCIFHGKKRSEHFCLYCTICFETLEIDECWTDPEGVTWDLCHTCGENEKGSRKL